jgi:hypothetical protein
MNPPSVYEVTTPRSHKTNKITKIVHSIFVPISQKSGVYDACVSTGARIRLFPDGFMLGGWKPEVCLLEHTFPGIRCNSPA